MTRGEMRLPPLPAVYFVTHVCVAFTVYPGSSSLAQSSLPGTGGVCITQPSHSVQTGLQVAAELPSGT